MTDRSLLPQVLDALEFAAEKHRLQRRSGYDSLPYINHLIKVSRVIVDVVEKADHDLVLAAVLHDIVEDSDVTEAQLAERYNPRIAGIVAELTDDMQLPEPTRKARQLEGAATLSAPAATIRVADKGCNLIDLMHYPVDWPPERKRAYLDHALAVEARARGVPSALRNWFRSVTERAAAQFGQEPSSR